MTNFRQIGKNQYFEWGTLTWIVEPLNLGIERLSVGLVTFNAGAAHEEHLHSGDEQVIYVISGKGIQLINEASRELSSGCIEHIPPYARHKVINQSSTEELKLLIVYTPSKFQQILSQPVAASETDHANLLSLLDAQFVSQILNKLSEAIDLSLAMIDNAGHFIAKTANYPLFCSLLEDAADATCTASYCRPRIADMCAHTGVHESQLFLCCNNIASVIVPIRNNNAVVGYIKCGQVFLSKPDANTAAGSLKSLANKYGIDCDELTAAYFGIKILPKSRLYAAAEATSAIAKYITDMSVTTFRQKELDNSRIYLMQEQMAKSELEKSLRESDFKLLLSQMNPHFLFNTLSTIAQMAYLDGSYKVADLVWNLSDLLRTTLHKTDQLIPLHEELEILKSYIQLQLARFGDKLSIIVKADDCIAGQMVPCMILQPLVENAVIHGLEGRKENGLITVLAFESNKRIHFVVQDNGLGFPALKPGPGEKIGLGLQIVRNRLKYYYGDHYTFDIESQPGHGTKVRFSLPSSGGLHEKD